MLTPRLAITNGASLFGRILPLIAAQKLGAINTLIASSTMSGIMLFIWTKAKGTGGILAYGAIYGISSGELVGKLDASNRPRAYPTAMQ
jgi:hypothetical protein